MARLYATLLITCLAVLDGAAMASPSMDKVERFKQRIDFDAALKSENTAEAVQSVWPDPLAAPGLGGGWSIAGDTTWKTGRGTARQWVLRRSKETISMLVFVSDGGLQPARDFFLQRATDNMMVEAPFERGPVGLGTLAVHIPSKQAPGLLWLYRDTTMHVHARYTGVDILPIAKWLQAKAESGLASAAAAKLHSPGTISVSARRAQVGQAIDIAVSVPPETQPKYRMELDFDRKMLEVQAQRGLTAQVRGLRPGRAILDLYIVDVSTLRSARDRIDLEFVPDR